MSSEGGPCIWTPNAEAVREEMWSTDWRSNRQAVVVLSSPLTVYGPMLKTYLGRDVMSVFYSTCSQNTAQHLHV